MADVEFRAAARADLVAIDAYSAATFGQDVADEYARGFNEVFDLLARHPLAGPAKPELGRGIRQIMHRKHRVLYSFAEDAVLIIRIIHHAQDANRALN